MGGADGLYLVAGVDLFGYAGVHVMFLALVGVAVLDFLTGGRRERFRQQTELPPLPGMWASTALAPVELAHMAAGADHAALVAYLCLVDRGLVRGSAAASGRRSVRAAGPLPEGLHPLEQAAFRQFEADPQVDSFLAAMRHSREIPTMDRQLTQHGLVIDRSDGPDPTKVILVVGALVLVPSFGLFTLLELKANGPSPDLLLFLVGGMVLAATAYGSVVEPKGRPTLTRQGAEALEDARRSSFVVGPPDLPGRSGVNIVLIAASMPAVAWDQAPEHVRFLGYPKPTRLQLGGINTDPRRRHARSRGARGAHGGGGGM